MPVELPDDLADDYFIHTLSDGSPAEREAVLRMPVREAVLWRHLKRYSAYLDQEFIRQMKSK